MSSDRGGEWEEVDAFYDDGGALAVDPEDNLVWWSGGTKGGRMMVSRTVDGGQVWERYDLAGGYAYALAIDPSNTDVVFAGGNPGLFRTTDRGATWLGPASGLTGHVRAVAVHPAEGGLVYAGTPDGVFRSTDAGATWESVGCRDVNALVIVGSDLDTVFTGTDSGVYLSTDRGGSWVRMNEGLDSVHVTSLGIVPGSCLYAGTQGASVYVWTFPQYVGERPDPLAARLQGAGMSDGVYDITGRRLGPAGRRLAGLPTGCYVVLESGRSRKVVRVR